MELKTGLKGVVVFSIFVLIILSANAFSVTGKQITMIHPGKNIQEVTITNSGDSALFVEPTTTKEQYYTPHNVSFSLSENWEEKFNKYEWQRVDWLNAKYGEAVLAPHTTETVEFVVNVPDGVTEGTFYAKVEVKDIGKKEGTIVIRPVYVSQVVAHISAQQDTTLPLCEFFLTLFYMLLSAIVILTKKKNAKKNTIKQ